jgi:galactokinase
MMDGPASTRACAGFTDHFGRAPRWIASAPGRVNLIGEFTDYNDGFVLPIALEHRTAIAAAPNGSGHITVRSETTGQAIMIDLRSVIAAESGGHWGNYLRGVLQGFPPCNSTRRGFDAFIASDVPIGAGLSSSAALAVAFATLLERVHELRLDPVAKAMLCQKAEHDFAGVPCGIMDPYISTMGREDQALLLDCRSLEATWLPFSDPWVTVLVINTQVRHSLAGSAYAARRSECVAAARALGVSSLREASLAALAERASAMDQAIVRRARHVISEIARTVEAGQCLRGRDWQGFGRLMDASHDSLRDDYEVSCVELDTAVRVARAIGAGGGVHGCRMTGGGFGGCAIALIDAADEQEIARRIATNYRAQTAVAPTVFSSRPGRGAELIEI